MRKLLDYILCRNTDSRSMRTKAIVFNWLIILFILLFVYNIITSLMDPNGHVTWIINEYLVYVIIFFGLYIAAKAIR